MAEDRRAFLRHGAAAAILYAASPVPLFAAAKARPPALLVPLTGERAGIGTAMARAATLVQPVAAIDTAKGGATAAAMQALRRKAPMILGPIGADETRAVLASVAGRVPVLSFSNDAALAGSGAFLLGLTAHQVTGAVLRYARTRGVRSVSVPPAVPGWAGQVAAAAAALAPAIGLTIVAGGADAVLVADARTGVAEGVQPLLAVPALPARPGALMGAWAAAPDPAGYDTLGGAAGTLAALAHDAAGIALRVGDGGRAALLSPAGFGGAMGAVRLATDGTAMRALAILAARIDGWDVVARDPGA